MLTPPQDESEYLASDGSLRRRLASIFLAKLTTRSRSPCRNG
jgi:hypothetical protein